MQSVREIRRKIRTVRNIQKITDAMRRVAAAKLRRVQSKVLAARPYAEKMAEMLDRLGEVAGAVEHPLLEVRDLRASALVVVGSDRGLCGSYNANIVRLAERHVAAAEHPVRVVTVGRKPGAYYAAHGGALRRFAGVSEASSASDIAELAAYLRELFETGQVDEVSICYAQSVSAIVQRPTITRFLPLTHGPSAGGARSYIPREYILEPDAQSILRVLVPAYIDTQLYHIVLEAAASEYGARMMAMTSATDSAAEILADLTLSYNKARQTGITRELIEIVSGASALAEA